MFYRYFDEINLERNSCGQSDIEIPFTDENGSDHLSLGDDILRGHMLVIGSTRTGKTNFLLQMVSRLRSVYPDSLFVILDIKGDFLPLYQNGDKVCSFYPIPGNYKYFTYNLIRECLQSDHPEDELHEISARLFKEKIENCGGNRFFPRAARQLFDMFFTTIIRHSSTRDYPGHADIVHLCRNMNADDLRCRISMEPDLKGTLNNLIPAGNIAAGQTAGVLAEFDDFFNSFFIGSLTRNGADTIHDFLNGKPSALFLEYDLAREESANLFFRMILSEIFRQKLSSSDHRKVFLVLDEFPILKGDYGILNALHAGAASGLRIITAMQSKEQVYAICNNDEHTGNAILGGFSSIVAFRPSDAQTISFIQERMGKDTVQNISFGISRYDSVYQSLNTESLIKETEIINLRLGEAYVKLQEYACRKMYFDRFII